MRIKKTSQYIEGGASLSNVYGTSNESGYTQSYINGLETYSTTEKRVGTWIDGKPIYRKVIKTTMPNASTGGTTVSSNVATNVSNAELMYITNSFIVNGSETYPMPFITSQGYREWTTANKTIVYAYNQAPALNGKDVYITIEYTKTTDTAQNTRSISSNDEVEEEDNR